LSYEIRLKPELTPGPSHAVQLIGGQFLLSHSSGRAGQVPLHRICIVEKGENDDESGAGAPPTPEAPAEQHQQKSHRKILPVLRRESKKPPKQAATPPPADQAIGVGTSTQVASFEGRVVLSYGGPPGSGDSQLSAPKGLVVSAQYGGCVFVADRDNNRVVVVDHALGVGRPLNFAAAPGVENGELRGPRCLHLDHTRGRLYIGEETDGGRLIAVDHVDAAARHLV
jgi:hypothetical protein